MYYTPRKRPNPRSIDRDGRSLKLLGYALLIFFVAILIVAKESWHNKLSRELSAAVEERKELLNEAGRVECKYAEVALSPFISTLAEEELNMVAVDTIAGVIWLERENAEITPEVYQADPFDNSIILDILRNNHRDRHK